ncbi:hypothetical protein FD723_36110 (plasmid) [Nostoc sp. C052]|uniref:hypothetical protein n=1 Tax=Nostoc sp. C052 TaxID=2576902 RepID=UPI0015C3A792|nr:hypothetical protein [Nostoc sp. C052]QLE45675.1 hypothetical protein FD723_36110 [Nostoc sp. C052]
MQSTDVRETIASINRGSGISNNMMAYRLALMIERVPQSTVQSPIELDSQSRQNLEDKLRNILTKSTQNIEDYRLQLKNKYLAEYSQRFGVTQSETPVTEQPNNFSRVENLITQRKHIFLQQMIAQESKANLTPPTSQNQGDEFSKKSLIPAVVQTIIAKGQDTKNEGRVYEGVLYRLQLLIKEGIQFINVNRKTQSNQKAFAAYKDHTNEFTITSNNLSTEEAQKIVAFNQQRIAKEQSQSLPIQTDKTQQFTFDKDDHSELGD